MEDDEDYEIDGGLAKVRPTKNRTSFVVCPAQGYGPSFTSAPFTSRVNQTHIAEVSRSLAE